MNKLFDKARKNPVVSYLATLFVGFVAGISTYAGLLEITNQETYVEGEFERRVADGVAEGIKDWEFAALLYKQLPSDINWLSRGLVLGAEKGARAVIIGPSPGYQIEIRVSQITQTGDQSWHAKVSMGGFIGNFNQINHVPGAIEIRKGALSGPIEIGVQAFYFYVDDVRPDGTAVLTIARREIARLNSGALFNSFSSQPPIPDQSRIQIPPPILNASAR